MYVDRDKALKLELPPLTLQVERGRLLLFAKAIGETNPIYIDLGAARNAGHPDLPAPPTFLGNAIELDIPAPLTWLTSVGVDITSTLHGEQSFIYRSMVHAGDNLVLRRSIADVYTKKKGALEFIVKKTAVVRADELVAEAFCSIAVLHPEVSA